MWKWEQYCIDKTVFFLSGQATKKIIFLRLPSRMTFPFGKMSVSPKWKSETFLEPDVYERLKTGGSNQKSGRNQWGAHIQYWYFIKYLSYFLTYLSPTYILWNWNVLIVSYFQKLYIFLENYWIWIFIILVWRADYSLKNPRLIPQINGLHRMPTRTRYLRISKYQLFDVVLWIICFCFLNSIKL